MERKRKSSEGPEPFTTLSVSYKANGTEKPRVLEDDIKKLCDDARISGIPYNLQGSPSKSNLGDRIWSMYKLLWFQNKTKLDEVVADYIRLLPTTPDVRRVRVDWKLQELFTKLEPPSLEQKELSRTPRAKRTKDIGHLSLDSPDYGDGPPSPPSPSKVRGLPRSFGVSKATSMVSPKRPTVEVPSLPPPAQAATKKPKVQTTIPQAMARANRTATVPANAPNISFKSTTDANSSFNKSFWSDFQDSQRTVDTAATSFSVNDQLKDSTRYGSVSESTFEQLVSTQKSDETDLTARRCSPLDKSDVTSRESEFYCSSVDTYTADEMQARADIFHADRFERRDTMLTVDESEESAIEKLAEDAEIRITIVNADIYNHDGPCKRQRRNLTDVDKIEHVLVQLTLPKQFRKLSYSIQWEVMRVLQTDSISPEVLDAEWKFRTVESLYQLVSERHIKMQHPPKPDTLKDWERFTRSAKLEWSTTKTGPLFTMALQVQRKDTACSLQRHFGADRVLYVDIPEFSKPPAAFKNRDVLSQFSEWIKHPLEFLGRTWSLFFLRPNKKNNPSESRANSSIATVIFVAPPDGMPIGDVVQWCFPYTDKNRKQSSRKAYMRLELALSRTIPATVLKPREIAFMVPDQLATRHHDDRRYEDPNLSHLFEEKYDKDTVMSDGCCRMSRWVALEYANKLGLKEIPPVLQARLAGAKGLWYIDSESESVFAGKPPGPLIHLAKSQVKVFRDSLDGCDDETLTVGVVKANPKGRPSILHMLFLPILIDRGVPLAAICELVKQQVTEELGGFIQALQAPGGLPMRRWFASRQDFFESRRRDIGIETLAGFPISREERVIQMLESGFDPKLNAFLAREVKLVAAQIFDLKNRNFNIALPKSTTLWGAADPENCLEPGEVCVNFGGRFDGEFVFLHKKDVLVARNPALAPWDIQKVRCVYRQQLARFPGMIFFSAKGMRPLANKLQGGDYDGDSFWITWEDKLVADFQNAPAPWVAPPPETFGITKDRTLLLDHIRDPRSDEQWVNWLGDLALKRLSSNMLGVVTMYHERLVYNGCPIGSEEAINWVHCHDYLVDSDKAGYDYDLKSFDQYKKSRSLPSHLRNLRKPTYYEITRHIPGADRDKTMGWENIVGDGEITDNVIDIVFFKVAKPIIESHLVRASKILGNAPPYDAELARFYNQTIESYAVRSPAHKEMHRLRDAVKSVRAAWSAGCNKYPWDVHIQRLRNQYDAIQPEDPTSDIATEWLRKQGQGFTTWDKLKASTFASIPHTSNQLLFSVAGRELCYLKINEQTESFRYIIESQYRALKIRKQKTLLSVDQGLDDDDDDDDDDDEVDEEAVVIETGYY